MNDIVIPSKYLKILKYVIDVAERRIAMWVNVNGKTGTDVTEEKELLKQINQLKSLVYKDAQ